MSAVAEAIAIPQARIAAKPVAVPAPAPAPAKPRASQRELWAIPFAITLAGSLALFAEQIAQYTSLL